MGVVQGDQVSIQVFGFELLFGRPCAVYLVRDYTSGKRKPYEWIDRAVRIGDGQWRPVEKIPSGMWFAEAQPTIERAYMDAVQCGMRLPIAEAA